MKLHVFSPKEEKPDIFDRVGKDIFDRTELPTEEKVLNSREFERMVAEKVAEAVAKIKLPEPQKPAPTPPQIVKETRVEVVKEKADPRIDALLKRISELEAMLKETDKAARSPIVVPSPGGSGVIGIPPPEAATEGYVLTRNAQGKAEWKAATGGSGSGVSLSGYTVTNSNDLKTLNVTDVSLDDLARVVGAIINDLQA